MPLIQAFLPQRCAYCGKVIDSDKLICYDCSVNLPRINGEICSKCGRDKKECSCKGAQMYFKSIAAPFYFTGNVRKGIHDFKFRKSPDNYEAYSIEMANTVRSRFGSVEFDFITEIPMTTDSIKHRGYNQCALLAKGLGAELGIEYKPDVLYKLYETQKQHLLSLWLRKGNLAGVFEVKDPESVKGKTILLCDDISTSGETLNECAKMLWLYGAKEVYCIAVALTKKHNT